MSCHLVAHTIGVTMADTIGIILEYLHRHHFSRAEAVLREEVSLRQQSNGPTLIPLGDDLDLDVAIYLKSMQEKGAQKHREVEVVPGKRAHDKSISVVKQSAPAGLGVNEESRGQMDFIQPVTKLEDPEPLFMEFEVSELERPTKPKSVPAIVNLASPVSVSQSPVSEKTVVERRSPVREIGLLLASGCLAIVLWKLDRWLLLSIRLRGTGVLRVESPWMSTTVRDPGSQVVWSS